MSSLAASFERRWNCTVWPRRGNAPTACCRTSGQRPADANQEVPAVEILQVLVDHQSDEQIAPPPFCCSA